MIANLPLLFAGGNPKSLSKMLTHELECFITFLVHCSWGHDTAKNIEQPLWWPENVPFCDPFLRPQEVPRDWDERLRNLVKKCYVFHNSELLLNFSEELSKHPLSTLQYVDNCDRTTSLYLRSSSRLLVTFRNENMLYDRKTDGACRKYLLPKRHTASESMVEQVIANIYLCDTCDEAFDNYEDVQNHEKLCSQRPSTPIIIPLTPEPCQSQEVEQDQFMSIMGLNPVASTTLPAVESVSKQDLNVNQTNQRQRRSTVFSYLSYFPFSSLAGRKINNNERKCNDTDPNPREHLDRYCSAPPLCLETPKWMNKKRPHNYPIKHKRTDNYWNRYYKFRGQKNKLVLDLDSQLRYLDCIPVSVKLKLMTTEEINQYLENLQDQKTIRIKLENEQLARSLDHEIEFVSVSECDSMGHGVSKRRIIRNIGQAKCNTRIPHVVIEVPKIDIIDLCSDDEESAGSENAVPFPTALHVNQQRSFPPESVAAPPESDFPTESAQLHTTQAKRRTQFATSQEGNILETRPNQHFPLKEFHINLYTPNIISID